MALFTFVHLMSIQVLLKNWLQIKIFSTMLTFVSAFMFSVNNCIVKFKLEFLLCKPTDCDIERKFNETFAKRPSVQNRCCHAPKLSVGSPTEFDHCFSHHQWLGKRAIRLTRNRLLKRQGTQEIALPRYEISRNSHISLKSSDQCLKLHLKFVISVPQSFASGPTSKFKPEHWFPGPWTAKK